MLNIVTNAISMPVCFMTKSVIYLDKDICNMCNKHENPRKYFILLTLKTEYVNNPKRSFKLVWLEFFFTILKVLSSHTFC